MKFSLERPVVVLALLPLALVAGSYSAWVFLTVSLLVITSILIFLRKNLIAPVDRLREAAHQIAEGDFDVSLPSMKTRELGDLATALEEMAASLRMRDEAILDGYRELEETNLLLQKAYEEQEKTSSDLKRSQAMYQGLFESASDAIVATDNEDRVVLYNRQAEDFFGLPKEQVLGKNLFGSLSVFRADVSSEYTLYRELLNKGEFESEFRYPRASDGRTLVGWVRASVVLDPRGQRWVQAIIRDVTREKETQANLEKSARELEHLYRMKDSFLGLASHELKTPLTVIVGYADLIVTEMAEAVDETVLSMVGQIAQAGDRLSEIVRDMVDVSMLDGRRMALDIEQADLNGLVRGIAEEFQPFLSLRGQVLDLQLQEGLPAVCCDVERLRQAIGNVVGNAIKFTPDGGTITVGTRVQDPVPDSSDLPWVEIVVRDTGIGISESDLAHIFDKFFEAGNIEEHFTAKYAFKGRGTGLGLTLAKGIVEMHDGQIRVESPGHDPARCPGSSFHILLPSARESS